MNAKQIAKLGGEVRYFGEGYYRHQGPRSSYGKALAKAHLWALAQEGQAFTSSAQWDRPKEWGIIS